MKKDVHYKQVDISHIVVLTLLPYINDFVI